MAAAGFTAGAFAGADFDAAALIGCAAFAPAAPALAVDLSTALAGVADFGWTFAVLLLAALAGDFDATDFDTGLALVALAAILVGADLAGTVLADTVLDGAVLAEAVLAEASLAAAFFGGSLLVLAIAFYTPSVDTIAIAVDSEPTAAPC